MRRFLSRLLQLFSQHLRCVLCDDDLRLEICARTVAKKLVIPSRKTIRAAMDAAAIAVHCVPPSTFPIRRKCLRDHLLRGSLLEDFKLGRRRLTYVFGRVFVERIWWVLDVSHI